MPQLRLYNTRTRRVDPFVPLAPGVVRIYVCGLTPSAEAHIGHARSFLFFDVLRRHLLGEGYDVTYVQNVTDIDDRSITAAQRQHTTYTEIIEGYLSAFTASMRRLEVMEPTYEPRATRFIAEIVSMIEELVAHGNAYVSEDGVYFSVATFPRYGQLSGKHIDELLVGARIAENEHKRDPLDFALWKFARAGEPAWEAPFGAGRPGWHIECSAMARAILGEPFDIHGGGFDLVFPHHENEIAQSESLMAEPPMATFWVHGGLLLFEGKKMSKSLGNFEPLTTLLDRHDPQAIRLLFLQTGYRKPMNFTEDAIGAATTGLTKLRTAFRTIWTRAFGADAVAQLAAIGDWHLVRDDADGLRTRIDAALDDDMNTSAALAELFAFAGRAGGIDDPAAARTFASVLWTLGIAPNAQWLAEATSTATDDAVLAEIAGRLAQRLSDVVHTNGGGPAAIIQAVIDARNDARKRKDFALADRLRNTLADERIALADTKDGTTWSVEA